MSGEDAAFFEQMASCRDAYRRLADCVFAVTGGVVLADAVTRRAQYHDFGAGLGHVVERLRELGATRSWAYDAAPAAQQLSGSLVHDVDLAASNWQALAGPATVVICIETAEHIAPEHGPTVVRNVCRHAVRRIVWSAAKPGQEWPGHINLQPAPYWLGKFADAGWETRWADTHRLRALMLERHAQHEHAADNFHVLGRT